MPNILIFPGVCTDPAKAYKGYSIWDPEGGGMENVVDPPHIIFIGDGTWKWEGLVEIFSSVPPRISNGIAITAALCKDIVS